MDYTATLNDLLKYYSNLLIVQYNGKPKATATIQLIANLILANLVIFQLRDGFDWRTAVGKRLDVIGEWVGVSRNYNGSLFWNNTFFSYPRSTHLVPENLTDSLQHGYSDYNTFGSNTGSVLTYNNIGFVEQKLSDDDYRVVIGLKIIKNSINHTCKKIDEAIWNYFNREVYTTWRPHEVIYNYPSSLETIMQVCLTKNVLPAPTGVSITLLQL